MAIIILSLIPKKTKMYKIKLGQKGVEIARIFNKSAAIGIGIREPLR
jgi:hypothetical protein